TKERYRKIVENANEWIWILDKEGNFTYANRAAIEDSGYKFDDWVGKSFAPIVAEEDLSKTIRIFAETMAGKSQKYEVRIKDNKGEIRTLQVNTAPLLEEGEAIGTVSVGRDVTTDKEKEIELARMDKLESLGVLAGGIAHDFNNLLMGIMGNISLARMNVDDEETRELLSDAAKASKQAGRLTEQLLTFARGGEPVKEKTSIKEIIIESSEFVLHGSNVKCEYDFPEDLWEITADKGQMSQVFNNIVLNADQSMPGGGKISISADNVIVGSDETLPLPRGKYVKIGIKDEGVGIPEEHLNKIFDPFFSTKTKGHGLGMTTVYSIIQKHKGHIKVESKLGKGTTFYIYLPATQGEEKELRVEKKEDPPVFEKKKILLLDDEEFVRKAIGRMLEEKGSVVVFAEEGKEAVKKFKEAENNLDPFDAVILDLTIPGGMGGKETLKEIRKIDPNIKIIVSSGYSNDPIMANYAEYGFNGVIAKPFNIEELIRVLNEVIGTD
ncbi:MAG: response regulator, partial [candidate division WOR-3 bacterium]